MTKAYKKNLALFVGLAVFVIGLAVLLIVWSPEEIVSGLGVSNGYVLTFFVSLLGGFSAGGSVTFISLLGTLVAGGLDPVRLGLIAGVSLAIGDMVMFLLGSKARDLVQGTWDRRLERLTQTVQRHRASRWLVGPLAYVYMGFLPLPNDVLLLFLASIEYPRKRMGLVIVLGDITFAFMVTFVAAGIF